MMEDMYDMIKDVPQKVKDIEVGLWVQGCTHVWSVSFEPELSVNWLVSAFNLSFTLLAIF